MKRTHELPIIADPTIDPGMAQADVYLPGQTKPFVISGLAEAVVAAAGQFKPVETVEVPVPAEKPATAPVRSPEGHYAPPSTRDKLRQYLADAHVRRFDKEHGTDLYGELQAKRRKEAIFLKAAELHLFDPASDYYKSQLRRLAK